MHLRLVDDATHLVTEPGLAVAEDVEGPVEQALRLREPVDLDERMIVAFGKRAVPWIWSVAWENKVWEIAKGTVRIAVNEGYGEEGKDFEVDYENVFIQYLKAEDCTAKNDFTVSWAVCPDHVNHPNELVGASVARFRQRPKGEDKEEKDLLKKLFRDADQIPSYSEVWSTSDPSKFMPKRPFKGKPFLVSVTRKGARGSRYLRPDVDFWFDEKTQEITLASPELVDLEKEHLKAWGTAEDNRTYQFPGTIEKGSVRYNFSGEELEEGKDFIVDYERSRVTLKNYDFITTTRYGNGTGISVVIHSLVAGEWEIR